LRYKPVSADDLDEVPNGEQFPLLCTQHEKSVDRTFHVTHGDLFRLERAGLEQHGTNQQAGEQPGVDRL
jgi:hypothetical protein